MITIDITEALGIGHQQAFEVLTDHAGYTRFPGIAAAQVLRPGTTHHNGVGAQRKVTLAGGLSIWEDITEYVPNQSYAYQIYKLRPPVFRHHGGRVDISESDKGCTVRWRSTISVPIPVLGRIVERRLAKQFGGAFRAVLRTLNNG